MTILFLTHRLPFAPNRGDRIRAFYLMREMSRFASVALFSLVHDDAEAAELEHVPFADEVRGARVPRRRNLVRGGLSLPSRRPLTHALLDSPRALPILREMTERSRPDVVVAYCSGMARFAMTPPLAPLPMVLDFVDVDSAKWADLAHAARGFRRWIYRREAATLGQFEARAARHAVETLVVNTKEQAALQRVAPDARITVLENGVDTDAFAPTGAKDRDASVIFCGVLSYEPNVEGVRWFVEHVWPRVRAARADARFVIVGADATETIRTLAGRDPTIELVGRVPEVQPFLWRAAVSVAPLHLARGLQNKVLEALAAGLPVVTTQAVLDGLPEVARTGCVAADEPAAFAAEVVRLLDSTPAERRALAESADLGRLSWSERFAPLRNILVNAAKRTV